MRPSGVPVCLMPVQQHELGEPASVVDMVGVGLGVDLFVMTIELLSRGRSPAVVHVWNLGHAYADSVYVTFCVQL